MGIGIYMTYYLYEERRRMWYSPCPHASIVIICFNHLFQSSISIMYINGYCHLDAQEIQAKIVFITLHSDGFVLQHTLQHTTTHCNTLQNTATFLPCNIIAWNCFVLQHTATHCNALQRAATHCNTLQYTCYVTWHYGVVSCAMHCTGFKLYLWIYIYEFIYMHKCIYVKRTQMATSLKWVRCSRCHIHISTYV